MCSSDLWFGGAIAFTFVAAPAIFSPEVKRVLGQFYTGFVAQQLVDRFFIFHYCCAAIALLHLVAEWVYLGRPFHRASVWVVVGALGLSLLGGQLLSPHLKRLHYDKYNAPKIELREKADSHFKAWHGVSQVFNLFILAGLSVYCWRMTNPGDGHRFTPTQKFRG